MASDSSNCFDEIEFQELFDSEISNVEFYNDNDNFDTSVQRFV